MKILFVCSGNTCRSPMAEAIARSVFADREGFSFGSRGVMAYGDSISQNASQTLRNMGIEFEESRVAKQLTYNDLKGYDLILTMAQGHKRAIADFLATEKEINNKVHTLYEYTFNEDKEIFDPYLMNLEYYMKCAGEIKQCIEKLYEVIDK